MEKIESNEEGTREYHPDIEAMIEQFNKEEITVMGPDGFVHSNMKVRAIDRTPDAHGVDRWEVTLYSTEHPEDIMETVRMSLPDFEKSRLVAKGTGNLPS